MAVCKLVKFEYEYIIFYIMPFFFIFEILQNYMF